MKTGSVKFIPAEGGLLPYPDIHATSRKSAMIALPSAIETVISPALPYKYRNAVVLMIYSVPINKFPYGMFDFQNAFIMNTFGTSIPSAEWKTELPGIDMETARHFSNGKFSLFLKMLQIFQETHAQVLRRTSDRPSIPEVLFRVVFRY